MVVNLVEGLAGAAAPTDELVVFTDHPWSAPERVGFAGLRGRGNRFTRIRSTLRPIINDLDAVLFTNYYTPPFLRRGAGPRLVTVIHDLQYRHHPENFSRQKRLWLRASHEATLRLADLTVTISRAVRDDVLASYGKRHARRVRAIPNAVSWSRFDGESEPVEGPYVLAVAAQYPHKNLATLVRGFGLLVERGVAGDARLVLTGQLGRELRGIAWYPPIEALIEQLGLRDRVVVTGYVDDRRLGGLYRGAAVFAFPSLFEGFALPPVEALGFRLPVLTSRLTSIPEVTLGLATYLDDPLDAESMSNRLEEMLKDPDRFRPSEDDAARIRDTYSPERIGSAYLEALRA